MKMCAHRVIFNCVKPTERHALKSLYTLYSLLSLSLSPPHISNTHIQYPTLISMLPIFPTRIYNTHIQHRGDKE